MAGKFKSIKSKLRLLVKALVPRLLFIMHGLICTDFIVWSENESRYWFLLICLGLIVLEGIFNVIVRDGKEFHWFCPSAFLYCIVLIIPLTALRLTQMHCLDNCRKILPTDEFTTKRIFSSMNFKQRISFIEQTGMGALIIGRWSLPKGSISKEQFLQIVLIYIGTAADILELSEIYDEDIGSMRPDMLQGIYYGTITVWALSVAQFSITIALPEEGLKKDVDVESDNDEEVKSSYFRPRFPNKVTPMSYMHYKSMLREGGTQYESIKPSTNQRSRESNSPREIHNRRNNTSSKGFQTITENALSFRNNNNSSLASVNRDQGPSQPKEIVPREGGTQPKVVLSNVDGTLQNHGSTQSIYSLDIPKSPKVKYLGSRENVLSEKPLSCHSSRSSQRSFKNTSSSQWQRNLSRNDSTMGTANVWRRVLNQYTFSKKPKADKKRHDSETEDNKLGVGKKEIQSCFLNYVKLIEMLQPVCMQDGPFFILRIVLLIHYGVSTDMTFLLLGKNLLVIVVQVYRVLLLFCYEPKNKPTDIDDPSNRLRTAMDSNRRLSEKNAQKSRQEYLSMYVLNAMQPASSRNRVNDTA